MRKLTNTLLIILLILPFVLNAQVYQLPNPGFENWDNNYASDDDEPANWNGFPSAECTLASYLCNQALTTRHSRSTETHTGNGYSCRIFSTSVIGIVANGNITTGRIHAGSTQAANSANYNYTATNNSDHRQAFNGQPDSIRFWAKVNAASSSTQARISAIIHDASDVRDPIISSDNAHIVGTAIRNFSGDNSWHEIIVPFDYTTYSGSTPAYILVTFSTNKTPGGGSVGDELYIDDIMMIYHAELSDLKSGGVTVPGFNANTLEYNVELAFGADFPEVTYTTQSPRATATLTQATVENPTATVVVTHGDQTKTYTIHYTFASEMDAALSDLQLNGETVNGFDPAVTDYSVVVFGTEVPTVTATPRNSEATVEITQPTAENPVATVQVTDRDSSRTYTVNITLVEPNADLSDLQLNGTTIEGFDPAVTEYTLTFGDCVVGSHILTATAVSEYATLTINQPEELGGEQYVGSVTVTCGELTKTYTVTINYEVGIDEQYLRHFTLYPNPANDQVTIVLDENVKADEVVLYNMAGQIVMSQKINESQTTLSVRNLQSGIYFAAVRNGSSIIGIQKIVKE